jgi:hypothetical protein
MNTLKNIDKEIIEAAAIEKFAQSELEQFKLKNGNVNQALAYQYFLNNHKKDLTFYKQKKQTGYNVIVLYKSVTKIFIAYFNTEIAKEIESTFKETTSWNYNATSKFCNAFLAENYKGDPCDKRTRYFKYKPSAEAMCEKAISLL